MVDLSNDKQVSSHYEEFSKKGVNVVTNNRSIVSNGLTELFKLSRPRHFVQDIPARIHLENSLGMLAGVATYFDFQGPLELVYFRSQISNFWNYILCNLISNHEENKRRKPLKILHSGRKLVCHCLNQPRH